MSTTVKDVMQVMNAFAPLEIALEWDNCGLLVGDESAQIKKLYIALDPTMEVIDEAIRCKADMIVTHHPIILNKINQFNSTTVIGQKLVKLIQNNIALYCAHTNLDLTFGGINDLLAQKIGLNNYELLEVIGRDALGRDLGLGRVGDLEHEIELATLANQVKAALELEGIHIIGDGQRKIKKVAVVSGSGMDALKDAISAGADVLITGDIKYHSALEAKEMGICLIDASHFGTENIVRELLESVFSKELPEIVLILDNRSHNPIELI